jgi:hypothetical protein
MGGLAGGLFNFFEWVGLRVFSFLIGENLAKRDGLEVFRVLLGGVMFGSVVGGIIGLLLHNVLFGLADGAGAGLLVAIVLLGIVIMLEGHEQILRDAAAAEQRRKDLALKQEQERINKEKRIADLKAKERHRVDQARQQGTTLNQADERRRAQLVGQGIDPDDPQAAIHPVYGGTGGCFIATAAFESPTAPEVVALRQWRDKALTKSHSGRQIIHLYYRFSPTMAGWVSQNPLLKKIIKALLVWLVRLC